MVFSSIPVYLDPPNWQQQQNHHQSNGGEAPQLLPHGTGGGSGSIRPGSMADRARMAKLPPPEPALKCPRCESTNTKFCYFNNYSLSQPRHFCKTCRRYWTRGGALRSVPVGGGCRRNKKSKRSRSKSPAAAEANKESTSTFLLPNAATSAIPPGGGITTELIGQLQQPSNSPFMAASLQSMGRYGVAGNMGLSLREILAQTEPMGFPIGGVDHQWRSQQFPNFLNGFESNSGDSSSYPFQSDHNVEAIQTQGGVIGDTSARVTTQLPSVKYEENGTLNLSRSSPLGNNNNNNNNNQYYSWTDLSGLASSSTAHLL